MGKMTQFMAGLSDAEKRILAAVCTTELVARQELANRSSTAVEDIERIAVAFDAMTSVKPVGERRQDYQRKSDSRPVVPMQAVDPSEGLEKALEDQIAAEKAAA